MTKHFEYNGYLGSAEVSIEDGVLHGRLLFIRDVVSYTAESVDALKVAFRKAVDDYLETCKELGDEPDVPCKGTFNVRVGAQRHRSVALAARSNDVGLNDYVCMALDAALTKDHVVQHVHHHEVIMTTANDRAGIEPHRIIATTGSTTWESVSGLTRN